MITLQKLIEMIFESMEKNEWNEDLLYDISTEIVDKFDEIVSNNLPQNFNELIDYADSYWRGYKNEDTPEHAFYMGRLYGIMDLVQRKCDQIMQQKVCQKYEYDLKYYKIFETINLYPGIIHNDLTEYIQSSKSGLSQFIKKPIDDGLIKAVKFGREKHYYLTPLGMKIQRMQKAANESMEKIKNEFAATYETYRMIDNSLFVYKGNETKSFKKNYPCLLINSLENENSGEWLEKKSGGFIVNEYNKSKGEILDEHKKIRSSKRSLIKV